MHLCPNFWADGHEIRLKGSYGMALLIEKQIILVLAPTDSCVNRVMAEYPTPMLRSRFESWQRDVLTIKLLCHGSS